MSSATTQVHVRGVGVGESSSSVATLPEPRAWGDVISPSWASPWTPGGLPDSVYAEDEDDDDLDEDEFSDDEFEDDEEFEDDDEDFLEDDEEEVEEEEEADEEKDSDDDEDF